MSKKKSILQKAFDKSCKGIIKQGYRQSVIYHGGCSYRGNDGLKCAVGHLIPDSKYKPEFDNYSSTSFNSLMKTNMDFKEIFSKYLVDENFQNLMSNLQDAHDHIYMEGLYKIGWREQVSKIADAYGLNKKVLNE